MVQAELRKLREEKLSTAQLSRAKKQFIGQMAIASDNTENLMLGVAKSLLVYGSFDSTAEIAAKIQAITAEELQDVAQEIFAEENQYSLIYQ